MNYADAKTHALVGERVSRSHWHWVVLTSRPDQRIKTGNPRRILVLFDDDGTFRKQAYTPTRDDFKADDWQVTL